MESAAPCPRCERGLDAAYPSVFCIFHLRVRNMTEKELKRLSREELLRLLIAQMEETQAAKTALRRAQLELKNRQIALSRAGSIAEAALQLNGVFDAAQAACQQYMENIERISRQQESLSAGLERASRARAEQLIADAEKEAARRRQETEAVCAEMVRKAKEESEFYWSDVSRRLNALYEERTELREIPVSCIRRNSR